MAGRRKKERTETPSPGKAALVRKMIQQFEGEVGKNGVRPTVGEFIRLVQLEKELDEEEPREVKVTWVKPRKKSGGDE